MSWFLFCQAAANGANGATPSPMGGLFQLLPMFIAFIAIMYFLMIRPQQKREQERQKLLASLNKGDEVVTIGGVVGTIVGLTENRVVLKVDDNTKIEFLRSAVSQVLARADERKK